MSESAPSVEKRSARWWALRFGFSAVVIGLLILFARNLEWRKIVGALERANLSLVLLAVGVHIGWNMISRVFRWRSLLSALSESSTGEAAREPPSFWRLHWLLYASYAANNLLPARAGEAVRTIELYRKYGYSPGAMVAVQVVEKIIEGLSLAAIALPVLVWSHPPLALRLPILILLLLGVVAFAILFGVARGRFVILRAREGSGVVAAITRFVERAVEAVRLLGNLRVWLRAFLWSCVSDAADIANIGLCLYAVGIALPPVDWCIVLLTVNLAVVVPSTPGQVGILEAGAVLALTTLSVDPNSAMAFAVLYHATHVVPTTLLGLVGWRLSVQHPKAK